MPRLTAQVRQDKQWVPVDAGASIRIKRSIPGGMTEAGFDIGPSVLADELRTDAQVHITSASTTEVLWTGRVASPGRTVANGVTTCSPTVDGDAALLSASQQRRPYVVGDLSVWARDDVQASAAAATIENTTIETANPWPGLLLKIPEGTTIYGAGGTKVRARTYAHDGTDYRIGAFHLRHLEGGTSDRWRTGAVIGLDFGGNRLYVAPANNNNAGEATYAAGVSPNFPDNASTATIFYETTPALDYSKADERRWSGWSILTTVALLKKRDGTNRYPAPQRDFLLCHEVIEDLLGRDLLGVVTPDINDTLINQSSTVHVDVLDYHDTLVTPQAVLDDLVKLNLGDFYYAVWPGSDGTGRAGLWWMPWPTLPRYVLPAGGFSRSTEGTDTGLCNRVRVTYTDWTGRAREYVSTATPADYPDLSDLGYWDEAGGWSRIVEAPPIEVGKELGSYASAQQVAWAYLRQVATRPRAGTAACGVGDVMDLWTGGVAAPEEILPGYVALIPETGETLRVTGTDYDDSTETVVMQLDSPRSTIEQLIARALRRKR